MPRYAMAVGVAALLLGLTTAAQPPEQGDAGGPEADAKALQGRWERVMTTDVGGLGKGTRAVKEVRGDKETVTYYGADGGVIRSHRVTFKLSESEPVRVFTYSGLEVLDGPGKGRKSSASGSFVYRLDRGEFVEVGGVMAGERRAQGVPYLARWKAVPADGSPAGGARPAAVEGDLKLAQGVWAFESWDTAGDPTPAALLKPLTLTFDGNRFVIRNGGDIYEAGSVALDASTTPKTMDATFTEGPNRGTVMSGIYKLDGDTFTICMAGPGKGRPAVFKTAAGSTLFLIVTKRMQK